MIVVDLGAGTFEISVVVQQMEASEDLLGAFADEGDYLIGTEKTMPVHQPDDLAVTRHQNQRANWTAALKTRSA